MLIALVLYIIHRDQNFALLKSCFGLFLKHFLTLDELCSILYNNQIMRFGERIRIERKKYNLTAESFAKACGVARSYITLIENGKRLPGKKLIPKIGLALNLKTNIIVNWYLEDLREKLQ